ncbi:hypothetical protein MKZ25_01930 [Solibacillus sp. FSL W7-1464]|uniref:hypothetical protein n=1 Tax=Solibacillus sp. FSL W7-1464 TaxID=2921706 RepID=UPI0030FAFF3F
MSLYRYFASKNPLPIIENSFATLEEDALETQFEIVPCRKNPPIAAAGQIQKPFVYKVRGNGKALHQLVDYIRENVREQDRVEFWSIWHSEKVPSNNMYRLNPQQITPEDLRFLHDNENCCIRFFSKNKK